MHEVGLSKEAGLGVAGGRWGSQVLPISFYVGADGFGDGGRYRLLCW